jgi:hypothetical protein
MRAFVKRMSGVLGLAVCASFFPGVALALDVESGSRVIDEPNAAMENVDGRKESASEASPLLPALPLFSPTDAREQVAASDSTGIAASKSRARAKKLGAKHGERLGKRLGGKTGGRIGKHVGKQLGSKTVQRGAKRLGKKALAKAGF